MPKTHGQPKVRPPRGSHTRGQPRHKGKGSGKAGVTNKQLRSYKQTSSYKHPRKY